VAEVAGAGDAGLADFAVAPAGAAGFAGAGAAATGAFATGAGFASGCMNFGVGMTPDLISCASIIRKKIPAIIAQTKRSMIPSMPLVSSPLEISQATPPSASRMKNPQIALISIAWAFGVIPSSLPTAVAFID
jgi:hypothetical protein